jgi:hypothetical protein
VTKEEERRAEAARTTDKLVHLIGVIGQDVGIAYGKHGAIQLVYVSDIIYAKAGPLVTLYWEKTQQSVDIPVKIVNHIDGKDYE